MLSPVINLWPATGGYSRGFHLTPAFHHGQKKKPAGRLHCGSTETSLDIVRQVSANIKTSGTLFWMPEHQPRLFGKVQ